ncbi:uncharacterized protein si:dkeyp-38g8.5 isoform X1 [Acanthopagrus latus]|uniref:uncharacterized protein si:dkeyp-38g8.5 isoform X1 n=2 Tax=Acanthopagrus latus TaxID=8177 RepID=UPI00187C717A|nr:uncharacterized protein si:dkeyp-38g8.5 isoform X1 [Acanthopagrus latus]
MEFQDHDYTNNGSDRANPMEFTYKMSSKEIEDFVKLRVTNKNLFSGRRNTSLWAWRAILKHMGLQHMMTHRQASKKWENLKKRYKGLVNPPDGVKVFPEAWPYFRLMDDAMQGRLEGSAPILKAHPSDNGDYLPSKPKKRKVSMVMNTNADLLVGVPEIEVSLNGDEELEEEQVVVTAAAAVAAQRDGSQEIDRMLREVDQERDMMDSERQVMERERLVLNRERAVLDREIAALDRDRASLERERAMIEREKAVLEREKALVAKDRNAVSRERLNLERDKTRLERLSVPKERTEGETEDDSQVSDSDIMDRRERFLSLFERLIENF